MAWRVRSCEASRVRLAIGVASGAVNFHFASIGAAIGTGILREHVIGGESRRHAHGNAPWIVRRSAAPVRESRGSCLTRCRLKAGMTVTK